MPGAPELLIIVMMSVAIAFALRTSSALRVRGGGLRLGGGTGGRLLLGGGAGGGGGGGTLRLDGHNVNGFGCVGIRGTEKLVMGRSVDDTACL